MLINDTDIAYPEHFNPCPDSFGFTLYEHWETTGPDEYHLLAVASSPLHFGPISPGEWFLKRTWAPASEPILYNRARLVGKDILAAKQER